MQQPLPLSHYILTGSFPETNDRMLVFLTVSFAHGLKVVQFSSHPMCTRLKSCNLFFLVLDKLQKGNIVAEDNIEILTKILYPKSYSIYWTWSYPLSKNGNNPHILGVCSGLYTGSVKSFLASFGQPNITYQGKFITLLEDLLLLLTVQPLKDSIPLYVLSSTCQIDMNQVVFFTNFMSCSKVSENSPFGCQFNLNEVLTISHYPKNVWSQT